MSRLGDKRLARRAARGDQRAFEQIYRRYHQQLYRFCLAMLGDPHDAQDALQNTMLKVLRALPGEEREIDLRPWLYRIARNEAVETVRRRPDRIEPALELEAPAASQVVELAEDRERLRHLFADLDALPGRQRAALVMRELSGLSFEEIGHAFETSPATARQTVYEARLSLRQMEAGREMRCEKVMRALSDGDGRLLRRKDLRAHLRGCASCRAFADGIDERRSELAALAPLPALAAGGVLHGILTQAHGGAIMGSTIAGSTIAKSAATVAVVAVAGVSTADRIGLVDLGLPGDHGSDGKSAKRVPSPAALAPVVTVRAKPDAGANKLSPPLRRRTPSEVSSSRAIAGVRAPGTTRASAPPEASDGPSTGGPGEVVDNHPGGHSKPYGRSKGRGNGHGRETAAAHKSPRGNPVPAAGPRRNGQPHKGVHPPSNHPASPHESAAGGTATSKPAPSPPPAKETAEQPSVTAEHSPDGGDGDAFQP